MLSAWTTNLGDGLALAAAPLLVARQTSDPFWISAAAGVQWLAPLLLALPAGVLTDRLDRRRLSLAVNTVRVGVLALLALAVLLDSAPVAGVLVCLFLLASAETVADSASGAMTPMLVARDDLALANGRLMVGYVTLNQLAGPPLGAALFVLGAHVPFAAQAVLVAAGAATLLRVALPATTREAAGPARSSGWRTALGQVGRDVAEGFTWTLHHAAVRTLVLTLLVFNLTFGAAWSVLVLYATQRLGLGEVGYGTVTTVGALGGLAGTLAYGRLTAVLSLASLMRIGLVIETLTHLVLAATTSAWVALPVFFVFGAHAFVWGTTSMTVRQRAVPTALQGRVNAVNSVGCFAGLVVGSVLGGVLASAHGVTAPFWFAGVGSAVFVVAIWPQLRHIDHGERVGPEVVGG
ncbi:MFS transporter [Nocardioides sp. GY 10127]|uniref:MFS transporter n=1 Tax=Nocardioides sp. GY 10127 TaxID=2569762 RepID=UPI001F113BDA|nr:MFS transporter [Nocardioides sp. GY 10127]